MSLTRKLLKGMGLTDEQIDSIIENHTETVNGIKEELDTLKTENEDLQEQVKKADKVQKELDKLKESIGDDGENPFEKKYNDEHKAFEDYKKEIAQKEQARADRADFKRLIIEAGIPESKAERTLKSCDISKLKRDKDGAIENKDDIIKELKEEWGDLIVAEGTKGADTPKPPSGGSPAGGINDNGISRAAQMARQKRASLYGATKKED